MRILIAEDDPSTRLTMVSMAEHWGFEPIEAENGLDALEILSAADGPLLALLDWVMPGLEGLEVCRQVREINATPPPYMILVTGRQSKKDKLAGFDAGVDDYIIKPFDADELHARLKVGVRFMELQRSLADKVNDLQSALDHIKHLQGLLPICSHCHKIRDDQATWQKLERYIEQNSNARLSHTLCPECLHALYPDFAEAVEREQQCEVEGT